MSDGPTIQVTIDTSQAATAKEDLKRSTGEMKASVAEMRQEIERTEASLAEFRQAAGNTGTKFAEAFTASSDKVKSALRSVATSATEAGVALKASLANFEMPSIGTGRVSWAIRAAEAMTLNQALRDLSHGWQILAVAVIAYSAAHQALKLVDGAEEAEMLNKRLEALGTTFGQLEPVNRQPGHFGIHQTGVIAPMASLLFCACNGRQSEARRLMPAIREYGLAIEVGGQFVHEQGESFMVLDAGKLGTMPEASMVQLTGKRLREVRIERTANKLVA